jgi:hypothetical protein
MVRPELKIGLALQRTEERDMYRRIGLVRWLRVDLLAPMEMRNLTVI